MKGLSLIHGVGTGLAALVLSTGCAHEPVQQVAKAPSELTTLQKGAQVSLPHGGDTTAQTTADASDFAPSVKANAEIPKTQSSGNRPSFTQASADKRDPLLHVEPELSKIAPASRMTVAEPEKKSRLDGGTAPIRQAKGEASSPYAALVAATPPPRNTSPEFPRPIQPPVAEPLLPRQPVTNAKATESPVARKSAPLLPAKTTSSHAEDYSWLSGQLQYSPFHKTWRLRYAGLDEVDPYGGSVTLAEDARLAGMKDGQHVRVEGRLVTPSATGIAPSYEMTSIRVVEK
jgi:hypothetical protein